MPTKRKPRQRHWCHPSFTPEVLALFLELEHTPARRRRSDAFKKRAKKLMYELGLVAEFWSVTSVLDTSAEPVYTPEFPAYHDWHTCRRVRAALLAASGSVAAPSRAQ